MEDLKFLAVTKQEAEMLMDSFRVSNPLTRDLALKAASLVLEFAAEDTIQDAWSIVENWPATVADARCG